MPKTKTYVKRGRPTKEAQALAKRIKAYQKEVEERYRTGKKRLGKLEREVRKNLRAEGKKDTESVAAFYRERRLKAQKARKKRKK
jgi:hypothetical protein